MSAHGWKLTKEELEIKIMEADEEGREGRGGTEGEAEKRTVLRATLI